MLLMVLLVVGDLLLLVVLGAVGHLLVLLGHRGLGVVLPHRGRGGVELLGAAHVLVDGVFCQYGRGDALLEIVHVVGVVRLNYDLFDLLRVGGGPLRHGCQRVLLRHGPVVLARLHDRVLRHLWLEVLRYYCALLRYYSCSLTVRWVLLV